MGIESDGAVKGCPSLQTRELRRRHARIPRSDDSQTIWRRRPELAFARERTKAIETDLWGYCASCDFGEVCLGGCTFTAHAFFGRPGNNPYCHYRARMMKARGLRERLVRRGARAGRALRQRAVRRRRRALGRGAGGAAPGASS